RGTGRPLRAGAGSANRCRRRLRLARRGRRPACRVPLVVLAAAVLSARRPRMAGTGGAGREGTRGGKRGGDCFDERSFRRPRDSLRPREGSPWRGGARLV